MTRRRAVAIGMALAFLLLTLLLDVHTSRRVSHLTLIGSPVVGQTLTISAGTAPDPATSYAYQWRRCSGSSCSDISGATGPRYVLQGSDVDDTVEVVVTAVNAGGSISATLAPSATVTHRRLVGSTISISSPFGKDNQPYYAAFASHNDRIVSTPDGIFMSYFTNWSGVDGGTSDLGNVIVARSTDGGASWTALLNVARIVGKHAPATMAVDSAGNVYALTESRAWGSNSDGRIYMFPKSSDFANDGSDYLELAQFGVGANKFAMTYDPYSAQLWAVGQYFAASVSTTCQDEIGSNGAGACSAGTTDASTSWQWHHYCNWLQCESGVSGTDVQYPLIYAARDSADAHVILLAWTEEGEGRGSHFYDMRFVFSTDDGSTWHGTNDRTICASGCTYGWQVDGGPNGPSFLINPSSETSFTDGPWLDNVYVQDGYFLFTYSLHASDEERPVEAPEYARFGYRGGNVVAINRILAPACLSKQRFCPTNATSGGFFSGTGTSNAPIYFTIQQSNAACTSTRIETLVSTDSGASWQDHARSAAANWNCPYGVSGGPTLTADGQIEGMFADMTNGFNGSDNKTLDSFRTA